MTKSQYENIRADITQQITKARVIGDHRAVVILSCQFLNNFPSSGLEPIEKAVKKVFTKIRDDARRELKSICPVCKGVMYDLNCCDDMIRPYCAKCGRTYTPMGYMADPDYALKWWAIEWNGGDEPSEVIEVH